MSLSLPGIINTLVPSAELKSVAVKYTSEENWTTFYQASKTLRQKIAFDVFDYHINSDINK